MTEARPSDPTSGLSPSLVATAVVGSLLALGGGWVYDWRTAASIAVGTAVAAANLVALGRLVNSYLSSSGSRTPWGIVALVKTAALFALVAALVIFRVVEVLPFMVGFGAMPMGITFGQLRTGRPARGAS